MNFEKIIKISTWAFLLPLIYFTFMVMQRGQPHFGAVGLYFVYVFILGAYLIGSNLGLAISKEHPNAVACCTIILVLYVSLGFVTMVKLEMLGFVIFNSLFFLMLIFLDKLMLSKGLMQFWYFKMRSYVMMAIIFILILNFFLF